MTKILVSGPIFDTPSGPSGQGGKLYTKLKEEGYPIYKRSNYRNPVLRVLDTLFFVVFNSRKYDVILIQMFSNKAFIIDFFVINIAKFLNKKIIPTIRGGAFTEFYNKYPRMIQKVLNKASVVTSPSHFIGNFLGSKGISVLIVPNFIETQKFPYKWQTSSSLKLLWVRAFTDIYKPELAIKVIHNLKKKYPEIQLTMVGPDQGKLASCKELIRKLDLTEQILITGAIPNDQLSEYYSSHSIYINTTSYESFGVALIEAACSGIPVVTTDVGEIPFMWVHEQDMLIVKDGDAEAFTEKVGLLLEDKNLQLKLSKNSRAKAEKYSWENIREQWITLLKTEKK